MATGRQPKRLGVRHSHIVPYGLYATSGGEVNLAVQNEREWGRFCRKVLNEPDLAIDERYSSNGRRIQARAELEPHIEAVLVALPHEEVVRRLEAADLPWGEYRDIAGVAQHPQLIARGRLLAPERHGLPSVLAHPMNIEGLEQRAGKVPSVGQDTEAILGEIGYSPSQISSLREAGAFGD